MREFKKPKQTQMYDGNRSGEKVRYYSSDAGSRSGCAGKHGGDKLYENYDANAADNIARKKKYKESDMNVDDEYDHDIGIEMYENRRKKWVLQSNSKKQSKNRLRLKAEYTRSVEMFVLRRLWEYASKHADSARLPYLFDATTGGKTCAWSLRDCTQSTRA